MQLLYGTGNPAKLEAMRRRLEPLGIELIGFKDLGKEIPDIVEDGITPLENAEKKAKGYYEAFRIPVFSCDSALYIDELPEDMQPGVCARRVNGKYLSDEEMVDYYSGLAKEYGNLTARYKNAICLMIDPDHIYKVMVNSRDSEPFIITEKPHAVRRKGFPIDSLSVDIQTGEYYYDLELDKLDQVAVEDGFLEFFSRYYRLLA